MMSSLDILSHACVHQVSKRSHIKQNIRTLLSSWTVKEPRKIDYQKKQNNSRQLCFVAGFRMFKRRQKAWKLWSGFGGWNKHQAGCAVTSLRAVPVPFVTSHGVGFQNCMEWHYFWNVRQTHIPWWQHWPNGFCIKWDLQFWGQYVHTGQPSVLPAPLPWLQQVPLLWSKVWCLYRLLHTTWDLCLFAIVRPVPSKNYLEKKKSMP